MKDVSKLGRKFSANIGEKNRSDGRQFLNTKNNTFLPKRDVAIYVFSLQGVIYFTSVHTVSDLCLYLIREKNFDNDRIQK